MLLTHCLLLLLLLGTSRSADNQLKDIFAANNVNVDQTPIRTRRRGDTCTTPEGTAGKCGYLRDNICSDVRNRISQGITLDLINYFISAIKRPCGFKLFDFTLCCAVGTTPAPLNQCGVAGGSQKQKIVGGVDAKQGAWPWAVILGSPAPGGSFNVICGGTLLNTNTVLTAAHCIVNGVTHVRLGDHDITSTADGATPVDIRISQTKPHPKWNSETLASDIAILKLNEHVTYNENIRPVCLPDHYRMRSLSRSLKDNPTIIGWGATVNGGPTAERLQEAKVPIVPLATCKQNYARFTSVTIDNTKMCAGNGRQDTCGGDSGGALLSKELSGGKWEVVGITSFGVGCADENYPGVYTRVNRFISWIKTQL